jgi:glycerophosphoryl diester phosphodiesterase
VTALRLAHRGDWRLAPENSLAAMRAALAIPGCDGLEFDVRTAADGIPIVLHDPSLERVQGVSRRAVEMTATELQAVGVPTLADVLATAGPDAFLDVELKELPGPAFLEVLGAARSDGSGLRRAVVSSFQPEILAWLAAERPGWPRWGNARDLSALVVGFAVELGCQAIAVDWRGAHLSGIGRARDAGLALAGWTVRRRPTYRRLERLGFMAICAEAAALDG